MCQSLQIHLEVILVVLCNGLYARISTLKWEDCDNGVPTDDATGLESLAKQQM